MSVKCRINVRELFIALCMAYSTFVPKRHENEISNAPLYPLVSLVIGQSPIGEKGRDEFANS